MTTQNTPGPWHYSWTRNNTALDIGAADNTNVAIVHGPQDGGPAAVFDALANARLISASPDLLDACVGSRDELMRAADLLEHAGHRELAERMRRQADECRAAIAKAAAYHHQ